MKLKSHLPHRLRNVLDQCLIDKCLRGILRTSPVDAASPQAAMFEVHLLLRGADTFCGLVTLKSLLRNQDVHAAVTITDDGSVTASRRRLIDQHVRNIRWLPRYCDSPELTNELIRRPQLHRLYNSNFHMIAKLIHPIVLGRCEAMIAIDADVAFLLPPSKILDWASRRHADGMYLHDHISRNTEVSWLEEMLAEVTASRPDLFYRTKLEHAFFNAGLLCFLRSACRLDAAEHFLKWRSTTSNYSQNPLAEVWLGDWTQEQTAYLCIFLAMHNKPQGLGVDYRIGGSPWSTFHHFLRAGLVTREVQERLRTLVSELA